MKMNTTEAATIVVNTLEPFASQERGRIITAALALLGESPPTNSSLPMAKLNPEGPNTQAPLDNEFFTKFDHKKPSDNVMLVAAYLYARFGAAPFSLDEVREIAENDAGLTIPSRLDMTLGSATKSGKNLFAKAGRGQFKVTVQGEKFLRETYKVQKGKEAKTA